MLVTRIRVTDAMARLSRSIRRSGVKPAELFRKLDADKDGLISSIELLSLLQQFQNDLVRDDQHVILETFGVVNHGQVGSDAFCTVLEQAMAKARRGNCTASEAEAKPAALPRVENVMVRLRKSVANLGISAEDLFRSFDANSTGWLSREELERVALQFQPDLTLLERLVFFEQFDIDSSGKVDKQEFCSVLGFPQANQQTQNLAARSPALAPQPSTPSFVPPVAQETQAHDTRHSDSNSHVHAIILRLSSSVTRLGVNPIELFRRLDRDGDGRLMRNELESFALQIQPDLSSAERALVFREFTKSRSSATDFITEEDFCQILAIGVEQLSNNHISSSWCKQEFHGCCSGLHGHFVGGIEA